MRRSGHNLAQENIIKYNKQSQCFAHLSYACVESLSKCDNELACNC